MTQVKIPAHVAPYVDALGIDDALKLILNMGGCDIYIPAKSTDKSMSAELIGAAAVEKLAATLGPGYFKIPLARKWAGQTLRAQGKGTAEIARTVRADVATVRRWLNVPDPRQIDMFPEHPPAQRRG